MPRNQRVIFLDKLDDASANGAETGESDTKRSGHEADFLPVVSIAGAPKAE